MIGEIMPSPQIQFRATQPLRAALAVRSSDTEYNSMTAVVRDCTLRYFNLIFLTKLDVDLSCAELSAICGSLFGTAPYDPTPGDIVFGPNGLLLDAVDDHIRHEGLEQRFPINGDALLERVRALSQVEAMAFMDAAERWTSYPDPDARFDVTLARLGFIANDADFSDPTEADHDVWLREIERANEGPTGKASEWVRPLELRSWLRRICDEDLARWRHTLSERYKQSHQTANSDIQNQTIGIFVDWIKQEQQERAIAHQSGWRLPKIG